MHNRVVERPHSLVLPQVCVEDSHRQEICSDGALEGSSNLDHPINHLSSIVLGDLVFVEWTWSCLILNAKILVDLCVEGQLVVLSFVWRRLFGANVALVALLSFYGSRVLSCSITFDLKELYYLLSILR